MRRKHHHLSEHEGESYFASFTDLLVGIIFIFIILLTQSAEQFQAKRNSDLAAQNARSEVLEAIAKDLEAESIHIKFDIKNGIIRLPEGVIFDVGQSDLSNDKEPKVKKIFEIIGKYLPCLTDAADQNPQFCSQKFAFYKADPNDRPKLNTLFIEGHTDSQPYLNDRYGNWRLSVNRAVSIYKFLLENFQAVTDLENRSAQKIVSVSGYSDTRPVSANITETANRPADRRIDLRLVMETSEPEAVTTIKKDSGL